MAKKKTPSKKNTTLKKVSIRMYCMGTGDCFVLKFFNGSAKPFTMMIDCGSCRGGKPEFTPYITNLAEYVKDGGIDLLVVTHEHQDHVNGFAKCKNIFDDIDIHHAWFAWTEDPADPDDKAKELRKKREKLKKGFSMAMQEFEKNKSEIENNYIGDFNHFAIQKSNSAFFKGLQTLAEINLPAADEPKGSLAGMVAIKEKLKDAKVEYLNPGESKTIAKLPGLKFHILGPPSDRTAVFKDGKEGTDLYKKHFALNQSTMAASAYSNLGTPVNEDDIPFDQQHILDESWFVETEEDDDSRKDYKAYVQKLITEFRAADNNWRAIEHDWLTGVGSLALRLNSHINNTSLAFAIEIGDGGKVLLFPGDAEFGSWESWHTIEKWNKKGKNGKHWVEDLLGRVIFYKVSHHLSYNGTPTKKGIDLMPSSGVVAMATLDRKRISDNWKSTMPNKLLLKDLIKRCDGKFFIMNEDEINNAPSHRLDPTTIDKKEYIGEKLYKEYTFSF